MNVDQRSEPSHQQRIIEAAITMTGGPASIVVIGYGNDLRGDDAVGPYVANMVRSWALPGVRGLAVHQLTPELAELVAQADCAIFVDACIPTHACESINLRNIEPTSLPLSSAHSGDPRTVLALAAELYGHCPGAWWVTIPAHRFEFGADLSSETWVGAANALGWIRSSIGRA